MKIKLESLISRKYKIGNVLNCAFGAIKDCDFEWEKVDDNHPYYDDILKSDICLVSYNFDTLENYCYFFIEKNQCGNGDVYRLTKVIFDKSLSDRAIEFVVIKILHLISKGIYQENDRFATTDNYSFNEICLPETKANIVKNVLYQVALERNNIKQ